MRVVIRADASPTIGTGHVMRCAALGMRLMTRGASVHFVCASLPGQLADWLRGWGFELIELPATDIIDWCTDLAATCEATHRIGIIDLLIVDHYRLDLGWERGMRQYVRRILVIDDLADRDHDCDLLLDQNLHEDAQNRYRQHVPQGAIQFLGPQYALLRAEFDEPGLEHNHDGSMKRLLVFFGGTDPGNQTLKVIDALRVLGTRAPQCTIVLGSAHPHREAVYARAAGMPDIRVLDTTDHMAMLMAQADLAIGTCGVAAWERCALGLPTLVVVTAENQREDAEILHRMGAVQHLGDADEVSSEDWVRALRQAIDDPQRIRAMAASARTVMAGRQAALAELERVLTDGLHGRPALYRALEGHFNIACALPAARAALGLMAVLRCWAEAGYARRVALAADVCQDVVAAILGAGCEPVFCDIDPASADIPEHEWARARAAGASVALVVHLYGNPVDLSVVRRHFPSPGCMVIDDAAQALGSSNAAGPVGGQGDVGLLSFGVTKHIEGGGAAILFRDSVFAGTVARTLASIETLPDAQRSAINSRYRLRLEAAREKLRSEGDTAAVAFHGLLDGYSPSLQASFPEGAARAAFLAFETYPQARERRVQKSAAWAAGLNDCGLIPVGMGAGAVPWRYTCRLPGIDWSTQHRLGEIMRSGGLNVSHWYLPTHWMCGLGPHTLPGTERLAREIFQFWVDDRTSLETIERGAAVVSAIVRASGAVDAVIG